MLNTMINFNFDVVEKVLMDKYKELLRDIPEFRLAYKDLNEANVNSCFNYIIYDIKLKSNFPELYDEEYTINTMIKKFYMLYLKGVFRLAEADNFDYIGEIDDPFACDMYNDNLEDR